LGVAKPRRELIPAARIIVEARRDAGVLEAEALHGLHGGGGQLVFVEPVAAALERDVLFHRCAIFLPLAG
jgi:hypothetical protein